MRCQNTLVIIYAQKILYSVSHPAFLLRKNPPFPQERAKIYFAYRTPHPSQRQCVCVNVICTPPRHLLPLEKAFICANKIGVSELAAPQCRDVICTKKDKLFTLRIVIVVCPKGHTTHITRKKRQGKCLVFFIGIIFNYSMISDTTPEPTVLPPSRIAKRRPFSIATGVMSSTVMFTLSPGLHISTSSGRLMIPVTSVVLR